MKTLFQSKKGNVRFKNRKKLQIIFLSIIGSIIIIIFILEIFIRLCPASPRTKLPTCKEIIDSYFADMQNISEVEKLNLMLRTFFPTKPFTLLNIDEIANNQVKQTERNKIGGANGISCGKIAFISSDLPYFAKKYVRLHEALHLVGIRNETLANYLAGFKEPLGLVQTVYVSLIPSTKKRIGIYSFPCYIGNVWKTFKTYFVFWKE
jgi:hypothetical protein